MNVHSSLGTRTFPLYFLRGFRGVLRRVRLRDGLRDGDLRLCDLRRLEEDLRVDGLRVEFFFDFHALAARDIKSGPGCSFA